MTPVEIEMLLYYHCRCDKYPQHSPATSAAVQMLSKAEFLRPADTEAGFTTTDRGRAYVEALRHVPWPEKVTRWEIPKD